jgi:hypothetical protein
VNDKLQEHIIAENEQTNKQTRMIGMIIANRIIRIEKQNIITTVITQ